jgi:hypothetical protein
MLFIILIFLFSLFLLISDDRYRVLRTFGIPLLILHSLTIICNLILLGASSPPHLYSTHDSTSPSPLTVSSSISPCFDLTHFRYTSPSADSNPQFLKDPLCYLASSPLSYIFPFDFFYAASFPELSPFCNGLRLWLSLHTLLVLIIIVVLAFTFTFRFASKSFPLLIVLHGVLLIFSLIWTGSLSLPSPFTTITYPKDTSNLPVSAPHSFYDYPYEALSFSNESSKLHSLSHQPTDHTEIGSFFEYLFIVRSPETTIVNATKVDNFHLDLLTSYYIQRQPSDFVSKKSSFIQTLPLYHSCRALPHSRIYFHSLFISNCTIVVFLLIIFIFFTNIKLWFKVGLADLHRRRGLLEGVPERRPFIASTSVTRSTGRWEDIGVTHDDDDDE